MLVVQVAAVARNGVIGRGGHMPWRLKSDLVHFRSITMGKPVVMGRRTFCAIGKPLAGRTNIILSRDPAFAAPGTLVAGNIDDAMTAARGEALRRAAAEIIVIGGADVYRQTRGVADRLVITHIDLQPEGDARFPPIEPELWKVAHRTEHAARPGDDADFAVLTYERMRPAADPPADRG
jgi:dihydrofolate reductase